MQESKSTTDQNTAASNMVDDQAVGGGSRDPDFTQQEKHLQVAEHAESVSTTDADDGGSGANVKSDEDTTTLENMKAAFPNLARACDLYAQARELGNMDDLNTAIALFGEVTELLEDRDSVDYIAVMNHLQATALTIRFQQGGEPDDIDLAISLHRQALERRAPPHWHGLHPIDQSNALNNLALALSIRFEQRGRQGDLNEAISLNRQVLELFPPSHPNRPSSLTNLASSLLTRFQQEGKGGDLDEAISLQRQALELSPPPHPYRSTVLSNLALALCNRFDQGGRQGDLDEAITLNRQALELSPPPYPIRSVSLANLANSLLSRFKQDGQQDDLDEAISLSRQALELFPPNHPDRSKPLNNLALALWYRFEKGGQQDDLDEAISFHRQALELFPPGHPNRFISLNNLATALSTRFERGGQQRDLNETILRHKQALKLLPPSHTQRSMCLNSLATSLGTRFLKGGQHRDLDEVISLLRQALVLQVTTEPVKYAILNNLAFALLTEFEEGGQLGNLNEAISLNRQALELLEPSHPMRDICLSSLAKAISTRFAQGGQQGDLDEAISLHRQALELRGPLHPHRSDSFYDLADLLMRAHSPLSRDSNYLAQAMSSFSAAMKCPSQSPSQRFRIATGWAKHAYLHQDPSAFDAFDAALQILPQLAALGLDIQSRHKALSADSDGLARKAARYAIQKGSLNKAVEYLDTGRAVFWSQLLHLRSPVDQLHHLEPELADRLCNIATALERGSHRDTFVEALDNRKKITMEEEASRLAHLDKEWYKVIDEVRGLDGFEDFLQPSRFSSLQVAAAECPVVLLISNGDGSHCLIMTSTNVSFIDLSSLPAKRLRHLIHLIQAAASRSQIRRSSFESFSENTGDFSPTIKETLRNWASLEEKRGMKYEGQIPSDDIFRSVLKIVWNEVVKPVIESLGLQKSEDPPVLQWCPTGLFSFLPIHAAGCYDNELAIECASDYMISSYTPTIGALLTHNPTHSTEPFKMMVVVQSQGLPSTKRELAKIEQYVSKDSLIKLGVPGQTASVEAVASRLSDVSIAHFACHGKQDRSNPLDSGLKLEDGMLLVSRIMKEPMPNGSLAFLCACETAMGDGNLPDEAMSLAASLLFAGFRHVIATMWEMRDGDGPTIADTFYEELFRGPDGKLAQHPNTSRSARALHVAVKKLRSKNVPFHAWVPFINMGK